MKPAFFRRIAEQCRELIARARTDAAKEQLQIWAEEFETHADTLEQKPLVEGRTAETR